MQTQEEYFQPFRRNIIGIYEVFSTPYGNLNLIYADWIASGRMYKPIEDLLMQKFYPFVGNTHSESSLTGTAMTQAYHFSHHLIKKHVNASEKDIIITADSGMTGVINKFQRILGLKVPEQLRNCFSLHDELRPVVFITHLEHHSNQTSWLETIADVEVLEPTSEGLVDSDSLIKLLEKYKARKLKIGSFSACSNVTGILVDYHKLAKIMHGNGGICLVDFACSAPYANINMHPINKDEHLDAIFFSPHKFLGGPGTPGVLIFNSELYHNKVPDHPGGGTVDWTNPWGKHKFIENIEAREDGGTPPFLQTIRAALSIRLKEIMSVDNILLREEELVKIVFEEFPKIPGLQMLAGNIQHRLGAISFYFEKIHYNLVVKLLNDRFGVQVRGGCSCAGTYGHYLLHVDRAFSDRITEKISSGDLSAKPGWVRLSLHPTMTNNEIYFIVDALKQIAMNISIWQKDYSYSSKTNEFTCKLGKTEINILHWFSLQSEIQSSNPPNSDFIFDEKLNVFT